MNNPLLFCVKLPIDKMCGLWYNRSETQRAARGRVGPNSPKDPAYGKFSLLLATLHMRTYFPESEPYPHSILPRGLTKRAGIYTTPN